MTVRIETVPTRQPPCLPGSHEWEEGELLAPQEEGEEPARRYVCWVCGTDVEMDEHSDTEANWEWLEHWLITSWLESKNPNAFVVTERPPAWGDEEAVEAPEE